MFKRLAKFRLLEPRRIAPRLREAMPANDNLPGFAAQGVRAGFDPRCSFVIGPWSTAGRD
jgi:hypothetical protein